MSDCIQCFAHANANAQTQVSLGLDLATQQPLGMMVVVLLVVYAVLTVARRFADRVDPPPMEWRPLPIDVPPSPRVWRFPERHRGGQGGGPWRRI